MILGCGSVYYNQNSKIVGGVEAVPGSWPGNATFNIF